MARRPGGRSSIGSVIAPGGPSPSAAAPSMTASPVAASPVAGSRSGEDVIDHLGIVILVGQPGGEALGLQVEHRAVATAARHQLVVAAQLHDPTVFDHADPV